MVQRRPSKQLVIGFAILVLAALAPVFASRLYDSMARRHPVEVADTGTSTSISGRDHRQSALGSLDYVPDQPPPPPTTEAAPATTQDDEDGETPTTGEPRGGEGGATTTCPLPAYPSASCTGVPAGTNLRVHNGDLNVDQANTVIDGLDIRGCVAINAPGAIIRRSKITCPGGGVGSRADFYSGTGVLLEDVEISCGSVLGSSAVADYNFTVRRANIHSCENGFDIDGAATIEHSYIHDLLPYDPATDPHVDGAQITPVGHDITIRHNTIQVGDGSAAVTSSRVSDGVVRNVFVSDNLMAGGSYTLYCPEDGPGNNYRVVNNHFSTAKYGDAPYGAWIDCADEAQVTGNVYHESGRPVPL